MEMHRPARPGLQAGTLSGNLLAMAAGLTTLADQPPGFHAELSDFTSRMLAGLQERADAAGIPFVTTQAGAMFGLYFSGADDIVTFADVMASDAARFNKFFHLMLEGGVYLAPSAFEAGFTSIAHGDGELEITFDAAERAFARPQVMQYSTALSDAVLALACLASLFWLRPVFAGQPVLRALLLGFGLRPPRLPCAARCAMAWT